MSLFISFEGGEGSGKSTQAARLTEHLQSAGVQVELVHEPGSTELGWHVRDWLKRGLHHEQALSLGAELFLFSAARSELVAKVLQSALQNRDTVVVADRYVDSTIAYQGYGRGIPLESLRVVNQLATQGVMPHLTFLLDCSPEEGLRRVGSFQLRLPLEYAETSPKAVREQEGTRFEEESLEFHHRVRNGYLELAQEEPERFRIIDAANSADDISQAVWEAVQEHLPDLGYRSQRLGLQL